MAAMAPNPSHCAEDELPVTVPANRPRAQSPFRLMRTAPVPVALLAVMVVVMLSLAIGCQRAPSREAQRDDRLADRSSQRRLPRHRLKPPIPIPENERTDDPVTNPITPGGPTGPTPEVYWVTEMAAGDPVTALTRHDDLMAAGTRGLQACTAWLTHRQGLLERDQAGQRPSGDAIRVVSCVRHMLATHSARDESAIEFAELAAALVPLTREGQPRRQRLAAFDLLADVYTAAEAPALAAGLAVDDAATNSRIAEALTVHVTTVAQPEIPADEGGTGPPQFSSESDWPDRLSPALAERLTLRPEVREVELVGLLDPATELNARSVSPAPVWQDAITRLATRSRAALQAAEEVWHLLDHSDVPIRSRAAHCLRLMSGEFAGYRSTADPLARQLAIARWSARLVRLLPARRPVDEQTAR